MATMQQNDTAARLSLRRGAGALMARASRKLAAMANAVEWESPAEAVHWGQRMPPRRLRDHLCGTVFLLDDFYVQSAVVEATRLSAQLGHLPGTAVLDVGSGLGRLVTGMLIEFGDDVDYLGIEPNREFYEWCVSHLESEHPSYRFRHIDIASELYNPQGAVDGAEVVLPVPDASIDVVYCWGVFTNAIPAHVARYISEFARVIRPGGKVFFTAYVEDDCPEVTFNPEDYVPFDLIVPLHVVRYSTEWLDDQLRTHGFQVLDHRYHGGMFPMQSEYTVSRTASS
ncbi:class I SAM-dependent methyltransferase [Terrabacter aerolatus]|nr:class I SAM-dependent methyltransferase [Terrabacter aerolatus]